MPSCVPILKSYIKEILADIKGGFQEFVLISCADILDECTKHTAKRKKKQQNLGNVMRNGGLYFGEFTQLGAKITRKVDTFPKTNIFAPKKRPGPKRIVF